MYLFSVPRRPLDEMGGRRGGTFPCTYRTMARVMNLHHEHHPPRPTQRDVIILQILHLGVPVPLPTYQHTHFIKPRGDPASLGPMLALR